MSELGGAQISNLLETLPGIAKVLRSPVADAFVKVIQIASRSSEFEVSDAQEILQFAVRRNLLSSSESDRVLAEVRELALKRTQRSAGKKFRMVKTKATPTPKPKASVVHKKAAPKKVKATPVKSVAKSKSAPVTSAAKSKATKSGGAKARPKAKVAARKR